jgi:hypothetical protein
VFPVFSRPIAMLTLGGNSEGIGWGQSDLCGNCSSSLPFTGEPEESTSRFVLEEGGDEGRDWTTPLAFDYAERSHDSGTLQ